MTILTQTYEKTMRASGVAAPSASATSTLASESARASASTIPALASANTPSPYKASNTPSSEALKDEHARVARNVRRRNTLLAIGGAALVVVALAIIISSTLMTVMQVRGTSMEPTVYEGDYIVADRSRTLHTGDIVAFYYNNKILLKRVIAFPGDWVDIDAAGQVSVNGTPLTEDYVADLALGQTDITFPYQVPENNYFVLGDHRSVSIDSRSNTVGTITTEQLIGHVLARVWPLDSVALLK